MTRLPGGIITEPTFARQTHSWRPEREEGTSDGVADGNWRKWVDG